MTLIDSLDKKSEVQAGFQFYEESKELLLRMPPEVNGGHSLPNQNELVDKIDEVWTQAGAIFSCAMQRNAS